MFYVEATMYGITALDGAVYAAAAAAGAAVARRATRVDPPVVVRYE